jgi:hypothetical protein
MSTSPCGADAADTTQEAIFRVAGRHIPRIKTENETSIIEWLSKHTAIPIPRVLCFNSLCHNYLGYEYILQERIPGKTVAEVYESLSDQEMEYIISQISDYVLKLASQPFHHVGGLRGSAAGEELVEIQAGPAVEEHFWHDPDISKYWPSSESFETLNISQPGYSTWSDYLKDRFKVHLHSIQQHPALVWLGEEGRQVLSKAIAYLDSEQGSSLINETTLRLAHRDLHFGNILIEPSSCKITGVIDWEFAGIYPAPLGDRPSGPFLWNCSYDSESNTEKQRLHIVWKEQMAQKPGGKEYLEAMEWKHPRQKAIWDATNYMRCIVEVCPRNEKLELAKEWWKKVCESIDLLSAP